MPSLAPFPESLKAEKQGAEHDSVHVPMALLWGVTVRGSGACRPGVRGCFMGLSPSPPPKVLVFPLLAATEPHPTHRSSWSQSQTKRVCLFSSTVLEADFLDWANQHGPLISKPPILLSLRLVCKGFIMRSMYSSNKVGLVSIRRC